MKIICTILILICPHNRQFFLSDMLTAPVCSSALPKFACDTKSLAQCVAEKRNTSAALVTPCLIRSLNVSVEGGLEICPSQGPSCPFPEVREKQLQIFTKSPDLPFLHFLLVTTAFVLFASILATVCC